MGLKDLVSTFGSFQKRYPRTPYVYAVCGNISLALMQVLVKTLGLWISTAHILYYRAVCLFLINTFVLISTGNPFYVPNPRMFRLLMLRCVLSACAVYCYFYPLRCLSISITNAIWMTNPIWTHFIESFLTKTRISLVHLFTTCTSFLGLLLITKPEFLFPKAEGEVGINLFCCGVALLSSVLNSFSMVVLRMLKDGLTNDTALQYFYISHMMFNGLMTLQQDHYEAARGFEWLLPFILIGMVLSAYLAQILLNRAIFIIPASEVMPFSYLLVVFSFAADLFLFHQKFDTLGLFGMLIICGGLFFVMKKPKPT